MNEIKKAEEIEPKSRKLETKIITEKMKESLWKFEMNMLKNEIKV